MVAQCWATHKCGANGTVLLMLLRRWWRPVYGSVRRLPFTVLVWPCKRARVRFSHRRERYSEKPNRQPPRRNTHLVVAGSQIAVVVCVGSSLWDSWWGVGVENIVLRQQYSYVTGTRYGHSQTLRWSPVSTAWQSHDGHSISPYSRPLLELSGPPHRCDMTFWP